MKISMLGINVSLLSWSGEFVYPNVIFETWCRPPCDEKYEA